MIVINFAAKWLKRNLFNGQPVLRLVSDGEIAPSTAHNFQNEVQRRLAVFTLIVSQSQSLLVCHIDHTIFKKSRSFINMFRNYLSFYIDGENAGGVSRGSWPQLLNQFHITKNALEWQNCCSKKKKERERKSLLILLTWYLRGQQMH